MVSLTDRNVRATLILGCGLAGVALYVFSSTVGIIGAGLFGALCAGLLAIGNVLAAKNKRLVEGGHEQEQAQERDQEWRW